MNDRIEPQVAQAAEAPSPAPPKPARPKYSYYTEEFPLKDRPARFLQTFAAILQHSNYGPALDHYARGSAKCARCASTCQVYEASGEPEDIPCYRSELLLRVYRRYFTASGIFRARIFGGWELTDEYIDTMAESFYRCTACRRCKFTCPLGVDHGMITHLGRWVLGELRMGPKALVVATREQLEGQTKNTSAITVDALVDTCEFLTEEIVDAGGEEAKFPIDEEDAEYVFFPAVSDYLLEADTLMGNAAVMHVTGTTWSIGREDFDGINYGLFYSDRHLASIVRNEVRELRRLNGKKILIGECGHASRSAKMFIPSYCGGKSAPEVVNCMELLHQKWQSGKIELEPNIFDQPITYHDPCNIARSGWIIDQPREILKHLCTDYREMTPTGRMNYCCGGGGGTVSIDEIREFRTTVMGKRKADQIRDTGAKYVVAPCANCKKQLGEVCEDNGLEDVKIMGLHDLVFYAIKWPSTGKHLGVPEMFKEF